MQNRQEKRLPQNVFLSLYIIITLKFPIKKYQSLGLSGFFSLVYESGVILKIPDQGSYAMI